MIQLLRKQCISDERYIKAIALEPDDTEVVGSFKRPFVVNAKDIKALLNGLPRATSLNTLKKLTSLFNHRYDF